jgi:peptidoglycan/LPS O-acetylase OafA/YrhL
MRVRLNKAYLIIAVVAISMLLALLSGPLIRKRARERARQEQIEAAQPTETRRAAPEAAPASP